MKFIIIGVIALIFFGCSPMVQKGDYVTYTSDKFIFINNSFIDKKIDCIELGELKEGGLEVKYCVGVNYASQLVQGFIFEHEYEDISQRLIGATLSFQAKEIVTIACNSETVDGASSGKEYVNCTIPQKIFDLHAFIINSDKEVQGVFKATVGDGKVYNGIIDQDGKALLHKFYKDRFTNSKKEWKSKRL